MKVRLLLVFLAAWPATSTAGAYVFSLDPDGSGFPDLVAHPPGYTGSAANLFVNVCIDPSTPIPFQAQMQIPLLNMIDRFNQLVPTQGNVRLGNDNEPGLTPTTVDWESVGLHELGHCTGLAHVNLASESRGLQPSLTDAELDSTKSGFGPDGDFDVNDGSDNRFGSPDDLRGDDLNLHWFFDNVNNPFVVSAIPDSSNYTNDVADLPGGDNFVANADRSVSQFPPYSLPITEGVMQQLTFADEDQRALAADEVATLLFARNGLNRSPGGGDDYTVTLNYIGVTTSNCDISFEFAQTSFFARCSVSVTGLSANDVAINPGARAEFDIDPNWFFSNRRIPSPGAESITVFQGMSTSDIDGGGNSLIANDIDQQNSPDGPLLMSSASFMGPEHGSVVLNSDGTFLYTHDGLTTDPDAFTYRVCANDGANNETNTCAHQVVAVTVAVSTNDPPTPQDDSATLDRGQTITLLDGNDNSVLDNDSDPDADNLTVLTTPVSGPGAGILVLASDGTFSYTHDGSPTLSDSFVYRVCDDGAPSMCANATVDFTINLPNAICETPNLAIPSNSTRTDTLEILSTGLIEDLDLLLDITHPTVGDLEVSLSKIAMVTVVDNPGLPAMSFGCEEPNLVAALDDEATDPIEDECNTGPGNAIQGEFTPNNPLSGFDGEAYDGIWTLTVSDQISGGSGVLNRWCLVASINELPVANPDSGFNVTEDMSVDIPATALKANDTDAEDGSPPLGPISLSGVQTNGTAVLMGQTVTFTHSGESSPGTFQYQVADSAGGLSNLATVTVTVNLVNDPPVALNDIAFTPQDTTIDIAVLANDSDVDGNLVPTSVTLQSLPSDGMATVLASGEIRYDPDPAFDGMDSFTYTVDDDGTPAPGMSSAPATVSVSIGTPSFARCAPGGRRVLVGFPGSIDTSGEFSGPGPFTFMASGLPGSGSLTIDPAGVIQGTAVAADVSASPYSVTVTADDGNQVQMLQFLLTVDLTPEVLMYSSFEDSCFGV